MILYCTARFVGALRPSQNYSITLGLALRLKLRHALRARSKKVKSKRVSHTNLATKETSFSSLPKIDVNESFRFSSQAKRKFEHKFSGQ